MLSSLNDTIGLQALCIGTLSMLCQQLLLLSHYIFATIHLQYSIHSRAIQQRPELYFYPANVPILYG